MKTKSLVAAAAAILLPGRALAKELKVNGRSLLSVVSKLKPGQNVWVTPCLGLPGTGETVMEAK